MDSSSLFEYDKAVRRQHPVFCGLDEAGRGPLAGDVFAAAVIFDDGVYIEGIDDSKKLTEKRREELYDLITEKARAFCVPTARVFTGGGNRLPGLDLPGEALVKGDGISASVAAASILAKVSRDRYMKEMAEKYPRWQFEKHKGYGTKLHYEMLDRYGESPIHRASFLKKYYEKKQQ